MAATVSSQPSNIHEIIRDCELFLVASRSSQLERLRGLYFKYAGRVSVQQELVSFKSSEGNTALMFAVQEGFIHVVNFLIHECKADCTVKNKFGQGLLHLASTNGNRELIELLINHCGLDVNEQGHRAITPVICAARNGRIEALMDLVEEFNADLTVRDEEDNTVLHHAAKEAHEDIVMYLVERCCCDVNARNKFGYAPKDVARKRNLIVYLEGKAKASVSLSPSPSVAHSLSNATAPGRESPSRGREKELRGRFGNALSPSLSPNNSSHGQPLRRTHSESPARPLVRASTPPPLTDAERETLTLSASVEALLVSLSNALPSVRASEASLTATLQRVADLETHGHALEEALRERESEAATLREKARETDELRETNATLRERVKELSERLETCSVYYRPERTFFGTVRQCEQALESLDTGRALVSLWKEELERERQKEREDNALCVICCERRKSVALIPCGHLCLCETDGRTLLEEGPGNTDPRCPVCREPITSSVRVFF